MGKLGFTGLEHFWPVGLYIDWALELRVLPLGSRVSVDAIPPDPAQPAWCGSSCTCSEAFLRWQHWFTLSLDLIAGLVRELLSCSPTPSVGMFSYEQQSLQP